MGLTQVSTDGVKNDAITKTKIPANQIEASELADNAVDTAAIVNQAVNASKIADGTITDSKLVGGTITNASIATTTITRGKMANNSVGSTEIIDEAVTLAKLEHGTSSNDGKFLRANNGADPTFETVTSTNIINNANNKLITGSGTANTLEAESTATYDGTKLFLSGGSGSDGHINMLELKHLNTASSTGGSTGDGPAILLNGYYANNEWPMAKIAADNAGGQFGSGYGSELSFWVHPANGTQTASVVKAVDIIGDGSGANLTITDGNLKIATAGHGIDFSADGNNSGMTSELLDDYEEGTWSPQVHTQNGHTNATYHYQQGYYTKVGRVVHASFYIHWSGATNHSGYIYFNNFPFNSANLAHLSQVGSVMLHSASFPSGYTDAVLYMGANSPGTNLYYSKSGSGWAAGGNTNAGEIIASITYIAA